MKKLLLIAFAAAAFTSCRQSVADKVEDKIVTEGGRPAILAKGEAPVMEFEKEIYDFKVIQQGEKVHYDFKFKNTGKTPLIISNASATCGCTVPEYPSAPVKPGEEAVIKVVFNSEGKMGMQDKIVTLTTNANPEPPQLHLVGEIKAKQ